MGAAIQFSGGKDSLAVLYLMRERLADVTVYFGDTGIVYPHMRAFVHATCARLGARLTVVRPLVPIDQYQAAVGLPADIVPVESSIAMRPYVKGERQLLQSSLSCCAAMLWQPLHDAQAADGITDVYRGSKACDDHVGVPDGYVDAWGITYHSPIWGWSDDDVFAYLAEVGAELPEHYGAVNNSFDCLYCTAFLNHAGAAERLRWTRARYPDAWPALAERLRAVATAIDGERASIADALSVSTEPAGA